MDGKEGCWEDSVELDSVIICPLDSYDKEAAKERASLLWLLSKAFDGAIPDEFKEPFYRDHVEHRRLKPKIVHSLANAELYCLALATIYSDPNYNNLDHHGIIQALTRKGISLVGTSDLPLTETVLVQTAPIKLGAHLAVIDGMMSLYIKEVLIPEKIVDVVRCFSHVNLTSEVPSNPEDAAILWVNKCCNTLEQEIKKEFRNEESMEKLPRIPVLRELSDISDGCSLAAVICFYCPSHVNWQDVCWNSPMSLGDSIYNLQLVKQFCSDNLPRQIDFLTLEDLLYVHPLIKDNVLLFVAELLFSFVIWPANCVSRLAPQEPQEANHENNKSRSNSIPSHKAHLTAIPNLRADSYGGSSSSLPELRPGCASQSGREASEKSVGTKKHTSSSERIRMSPRLQRTSSSGVVNGFKSSNTSLDGVNTDQRLSSCGNVRRDASCLSMPGDDTFRPPDGVEPSDNQMSAGLEVYYHRLSGTEGPVRSGSLTNVRDDNWGKSGNERPSLKSSSSSQSSGICISETDKHPMKTSFAKLLKEPDAKSRGINIVYMHRERESTKCKSTKPGSSKDKHATFAALPNTTTWQQQRVLSSNSSQADSGHETPVEQSDSSLNTQLANLRMKLEEKRKKIEMEKKRREAMYKKEWQKVGKVAFLQAMSRSCAAEVGTPDSGTGKEDDYAELSVSYMPLEAATSSPSMVRRMSIQEIAEDLDSMQKKWLHGGGEAAAAVEQVLIDAPDSQMSCDFEASMEQLNSSLCDLQADISRITIQQEHVENLLQDSVEDVSHFFLHGEASTSQVRESPSKSWSKSPPSSYTVHPGSAHLFHSDLSPQRQLYHGQSLIERRISQEEAALPTSPSEKRELQTANIEELYSKVIKPANRQKLKASNHCFSLPDEPNAKKDVRQYQQGYGSPSRTGNQAQMPKASPRHNQSVAANASPQKRPSEGDQRFYISFNDQPNKITTKWQRADDKSTPTLPTKPPDDSSSFGFVIGADLVHPDPETEVEMAKKKEMIMNMSIQRRADHENRRITKEQEYARLREEEQRKREYLEKKREEEKQRRQAILEQYRQRKLQEELLEKEGLKEAPAPARSQTGVTKSRSSAYPLRKTDNRICSDFTKPITELRTHVAPYNRATTKPRPKSSFISSTVPDLGLYNVDSAVANKRNSQFISTSKDIPDFDIDSLNSTGTSVSSRDPTRSPMNGQALSSHCSGDGVLRPPESGGRSSDGASDTTSTSSNAAVMIEYTGPKLFVKPTAKSNRGIIINAINTVLAGAVNSETKRKVLDEINRSESKHFLILFRDAGCQFRSVYSYNPDTDEVIKLFGIGPKAVSVKVMEKFYKYNSGGKCFSEVQTKHLTVTIDAFTIPNSLWAGKKVVAARKEFF